MEDRLIHSTALNLADRLNRYAHREGNDYLRLVYGMEVVIMNVSKLIIVLLIAQLADILAYTVAALVGFNVIRRPACGLHAGSSTVCTIWSITLFILIPYLLRGLTIGNFVVAPIFCVIILLLFLYAPADTESKPLVGKKKRAWLKKKAVISGILLMTTTLLIGNANIKMMVTLGAIYEVAFILPLAYGILNKKYNNYVQYENQTCL